MLSLSQFPKEVKYKTSMCTTITCVYAYVTNDSNNLTLIPKEEFINYDFVGYRTPKNTFPDVKKIML